MHDPRVCDTDAVLHALANTTRFDRLWEGYQEFKHAVEETAPEGLSLRDKDRYLWGMSFHRQLERDVADVFSGKTHDDDD